MNRRIANKVTQRIPRTTYKTSTVEHAARIHFRSPYHRKYIVHQYKAARKQARLIRRLLHTLGPVVYMSSCGYWTNNVNTTMCLACGEHTQELATVSWIQSALKMHAEFLPYIVERMEMCHAVQAVQAVHYAKGMRE